VIFSYTPFISSISFLNFLNHVLSLSRRRVSLELPLKVYWGFRIFELIFDLGI
jgi:hypothetical protein